MKTSRSHTVAAEEQAMLDGVSVRVIEAGEQRRFDELIVAHHYLDPIAAIKCRMEQLGLSNNDLATYLGGRSRVSEVLNRRRSLAVRMMRRRHKELQRNGDRPRGTGRACI